MRKKSHSSGTIFLTTMLMRKDSERKESATFGLKRTFWFPWFVFWMVLLPSIAFAGHLSVVTTIFPLKEFAQAVGGERAKVTLLLPPGAEPHTWEPRPSDIVRISQADVFIYIGTDIEPWIPGILKAVENPRLDIIEASEGLPLIAGEGDHHDQAGGHGKGKAVPEGRDPHVWLDFEYDERIVDKIVAALTRRDPASADHYRRNGERYQKRLKELDLAYRRKLMHCESKTIVLGSHAAFAYMAQRYGLTQIPLYGVSPDSEPTPKKMAEVIKVAKQYRVRAIYYEELVSDKLAKAIAHEVGATLLILNAGHNLTKAQIESGVTFLSLMDTNLENLAYGLGCQ